MSAQTKGILHGIRVLDLSRMLSGPYCTMMLADHGAEVIKIEDPKGDTSRTNGPFRDDDPGHDWAGYFVSLNRSKKSVVLDLKTEAGRDRLRTLVRTADVLVENFRPGVMERLGLSYESLAEINPALVYAAIRGFGDPRSGASPYADWPSYDVVAQAMGGLISLTGPDADTPTKTGPGIGDVFAGMMMSFGILAALRAAEATGQGQFIDVAMYDAMISLCERAVYQHDFDGTVPGPEGNGHPLLAPFGIFPAKDGNIALGIVDDAFWVKLLTAMGRDDLVGDTRYATRQARRREAAAVNGMVAEWTAKRTKAELARLLGGLVPFGPVNTVADIFADPHVAARGMVVTVPHADPALRPWRVAANPLRFSTHPAPPPATPARLGADGALAEVADAPSPDPRALRDAFGAFATGVTILTTRQADGTPRGFTANSFTSVSLDPPLLLVCLAKSAHSCEVFLSNPHFGVNVLSAGQKAVSGLFASRAPDKFDKCVWTAGHSNVPLIDGSLAQFVCARERSVDAGDHIVLIGRVLDFAATEGAPLGYYRGNYFSSGMEQHLVDAVAAKGGTRIGAVLTQGDMILLAQSRVDGTLTVPTAPGAVPSLDGLRAKLHAEGLSADVDFLYAVYEDRETGAHGIFYHGQVSGRPPEGMVLLPLDDLPLDRIANEAERSMLRRYGEEFRLGAFGIYQGNETTGKVRRITDA
ncbi:MAG: CoA transferase [Rhodobacteraceae bacterium]|nr:CoA transferase [Paracoccaceae bacterium]